ncbi:MAG: AraC family transcriptional regulator [Clostridia bacterium]|nr:AraC family transcriptional regulator [Clostridia bacterium]
MREYKSNKYIKGGLSLGIFKATDALACGEHTHEFTEIVYVTDGTGIETIDGTEHSVRRGDLLFINCGAVHKVAPVLNYSYINICFSPDIIGERIITRENAFDLLSLSALEEFRHEYGADTISFIGEERRLVEALLFDMLNEFKSDLPERAAVLESYMSVLIAKIMRKRRIKTENDGKSEMWRELSRYIEDNIDKPLTLGELAKKCFYNPSYFSRVFKEKFGTTLVDHVMNERTRAAAKLLSKGEISIDAVAEECGFGDRTGLYRAFIKIYGISPAEYRKRAKK